MVRPRLSVLLVILGGEFSTERNHCADLRPHMRWGYLEFLETAYRSEMEATTASNP